MALLSLLAFPAPAAHAATITVTLQTTVTAVFGLQADQFMMGESVRITYSFDDQAVDNDPDLGEGSFFGNLSRLDIEFLGSGLSFLFGGSGSGTATADNVSGTMDSLGMASTDRLGGDLVDGATPTGIQVGLNGFGSPPNLVVDDGPGPAPFSFINGTLTVVTDGSLATSFTIGSGVSSVPEPGLALLLGASLVPVALRMRRR